MRLGPLDAGQVADLRSYLDAVPDPRSRRGRWYSLTAILLVCACAAVSGARSIEELAEWGQRASNALLVVIGIRRHLLGWRRTPSPATIGRVLGTVDGSSKLGGVGEPSSSGVLTEGKRGGGRLVGAGRPWSSAIMTVLRQFDHQKPRAWTTIRRCCSTWTALPSRALSG
ncbi:transposase family protein [Streptomyces sp. NBC_01571]|uniref:transposase family protein n=1 Tax=Streptomyces sp. NBC_01571 TaxID=2975883 RepID=UPI002255239F|nr:transposase family protein [Streptomyces sp. NBC_01571]MCX4581202.1 transposase family protein [Streptomyces sp. NBC_01571]